MRYNSPLPIRSLLPQAEFQLLHVPQACHATSCHGVWMWPPLASGLGGVSAATKMLDLE